MPLFSVRPFQRPYAPLGRVSLLMRVFTAFERFVKRLLFGCRMCGNCILQETAFVCPMACPKGLRNGPCGGSTAKGCYVDRGRPCVWYRIFQRSERLGRLDRLVEIQAPLDWAKAGRETWLALLGKARARLKGKLLRLFIDRRERAREVGALFLEVRQPEWWGGDDKQHPRTPEGTPVSALEACLRRGDFAVTAECTPPVSSSAQPLRKRLEEWKGLVDAVNFTDNPSSTPRMSSFACATLGLETGHDPVLQITARDINRTSLQSDALGAAALGIRNVLCISGDHSSLGPSPIGRLEPLDVDPLHMLWILRRMRDEARFLDGREIKTPPSLFLGAAASPFSSEIRYQALREEKKVNAGAQFLQTQCVFDLDRFEAWLEALDARGVLGRVAILPGVTPLRSAGAARYMDSEVPGITVPAEVIQRMQRAKDAKEEGVAIALETIERLRRLQGVSGIHVMAVGWEAIVPRLIRESGIERRLGDRPATRPSSRAGDEAVVVTEPLRNLDACS